MHAVGVLHRDVKPSNVLMEGRNPILIDFGLARVADDPKLTHTGWLLGTPGYLAPEILHGDDATEASDIHSWAATVAYAGTGRAPFGRGPSMAIMDRVRRGQHDLSGLPGRPAPGGRRRARPRPDAPADPAAAARLAARGAGPGRRPRCRRAVDDRRPVHRPAGARLAGRTTGRSRSSTTSREDGTRVADDEDPWADPARRRSPVAQKLRRGTLLVDRGAVRRRRRP